MERQFLTTEEIAKHLGVSRQHVVRLIRRGDLPGIRAGHVIRVPVAGWEAWLAEQTAAGIDGAKLGGGHAQAA